MYKTKAAVLEQGAKKFEIMELDVDEPGEGEVRIRYAAAGLCHSDLHLIDGDIIPRFPIVAGHEGAGIVEAVGPGVIRVQEGDHVVCSFIPSCGSCRYCATGRSNLCNLGVHLMKGEFPDGTFRAHKDGRDIGQRASSAPSPNAPPFPSTHWLRSTTGSRLRPPCWLDVECQPAGVLRSTRAASASAILPSSTASVASASMPCRALCTRAPSMSSRSIPSSSSVKNIAVWRDARVRVGREGGAQDQ